MKWKSALRRAASTYVFAADVGAVVLVLFLCVVLSSPVMMKMASLYYMPVAPYVLNYAAMETSSTVGRKCENTWTYDEFVEWKQASIDIADQIGKEMDRTIVSEDEFMAAMEEQGCTAYIAEMERRADFDRRWASQADANDLQENEDAE